MSHSWMTHSPDETLAFGEAVGQALEPGTCLALNGPLGSGKTQFVKGVALGLGIPAAEPIVSPTFVLAREYAGRLPLYHLDTYRLSDADELAALGFEEMLEAGGVVAVEWADRTTEVIPSDAWWLTFEHLGPSDRRITLESIEISPKLQSALSATAELSPIDNAKHPTDTTS